jgi:hypothetical protein
MRLFSKLIERTVFKSVVVLIIIIQYQPMWSQSTDMNDYCISENELKLAALINQIREDYDTKKLQLSASLSFVAKLHVEDLYSNHPDTSICGLSSWSDKGGWKACCYNKYVLDEDCMWAKPRELTSYPYRGYELVTYLEDDFTIDTIIKIWSGTKEVLDMILAKGNYESKKWVCMGIGVNKDYVSLWFGQRTDPAGRPAACDTLMSVVENTEITQDDNSSFYIVFGSFEDRNDAKEALRRINKEDFPEADILSSSGLNRVYLGQYSSLKAAMLAKQNLPYTYREAWILKD